MLYHAIWLVYNVIHWRSPSFAGSEGGEYMFGKAWQWAKAQNRYLLSAGLGLFGLVDTITPGSVADHWLGRAIILVAIYMWVFQ